MSANRGSARVFNEAPAWAAPDPDSTPQKGHVHMHTCRRIFFYLCTVHKHTSTGTDTKTKHNSWKMLEASALMCSMPFCRVRGAALASPVVGLLQITPRSPHHGWEMCLRLQGGWGGRVGFASARAVSRSNHLSLSLSLKGLVRAPAR